MANTPKLLRSDLIDFAHGEKTFGLGIRREEWETKRGAEIYWKYELPDTAQIMGVTPDKKIVAVTEFQPGVGGEYFHLPGETLEPAEKPMEAAKRGLLEETGYVGNVVLLSSVLKDSGRSNSLIHLCLALDCHKIQKGEKEIRTKLVEPMEFWLAMMDYFSANPASRHGGGNTLKLIALAFHKLGWLKIKMVIPE